MGILGQKYVSVKVGHIGKVRHIGAQNTFVKVRHIGTKIYISKNGARLENEAHSGTKLC